MKKYLVLCIGCLPIFITDCFGVLDGVVGGIIPTSEAECAASCTKTHCCTTGVGTSTTTCPTGWTLKGTECERAPETIYSETLHRYETTSYSSCEAKTLQLESSWICTNEPDTGSDVISSGVVAWVDCCSIDGPTDLCKRTVDGTL